VTIKKDLYLERLNVYGTESKDGNIEKQKQMILNNFTTHPSFQEVLIETVDRGVHIVEISALERLPYKKRILSNPNETFEIGDYVNWKSNDWLIMNVDDNKDVDYKGVISKCNNLLKWKDENGAIHSYPCNMKDIISDDGTDDNKVINTFNGAIRIKVQLNQYTNELKENDRFIFDNLNSFSNTQISVYKITNIKNFMNGLIIEIYMNIDQISEQDDLVNNIANAFDNIYTVEINQGDLSESIGYSTQLTTTIKLNDEVVTGDIIWTSSDEAICTVDSSGNISLISTGNCAITANLDGDSSVFDSINIEVATVPVSNIEVRITPNVTEVLKFVTEAYTVFKFDNNVQEVDTFSYSLSGADSSKYEFINISGNSFSVKSLEFDYVKLKVTCTSDVDSSIGEIGIQLKNAF